VGDAAGLGLDPVRDALLADAQAAADRVARDAEERASDQVAQAHREIEARVARARTEGETAAELETISALAEARRRARALVLEAQRDVHDGVRRQAEAAVQELRSTPRYGALLDRLSARAQEVLGPGAQIERDPPEGGVVACAGNRRLVYTLPALVERCLAEHAHEIDRLWR
jgi:vacuolar-type H+-ATPase subunit E/Vma4